MLAPQLDVPPESSTAVHSDSQMRWATLHRDLGLGDPAQEHQELVAAEAPDLVVVAAGDLQALGDQDEQLVAGGVAEACR